MGFQKYCISEKYTIKEAIAAIENSRERNVLVLNDTGKLVGVLSQGDVLKAILNGTDIYAQVKHIYNKSFIYFNTKDMPRAIEMVKNKNINLIPVVNEDFEVTGIITINDILIYLEKE